MHTVKSRVIMAVATISLVATGCSGSSSTMPVDEWLDGPFHDSTAALVGVGEIQVDSSTGEFDAVQCDRLTLLASDAAAAPLPDHAELASSWQSFVASVADAGKACTANDPETFLAAFADLGRFTADARAIVEKL
jgi:hypothetical protein